MNQDELAVDPKDIINNILTRTSVREYNSARPVTSEVIDEILHAAMSAPSGVNRRPWAFVTIDDPNILNTLASSLPYAKMAAKATFAIVVCGDSTRFLEGDDATLWVQDLSAASENILLAAHANGLGSVWTSVYPHPDRQQAVSRILSLPDHIIPFNVIPMGYPGRPHHAIDKWDPTRIHQNKW